jgi:hypothetical protein
MLTKRDNQLHHPAVLDWTLGDYYLILTRLLRGKKKNLWVTGISREFRVGGLVANQALVPKLKFDP